jgi:hypothetical protein
MMVAGASKGYCDFYSGSELLEMCSATENDPVYFQKQAECRGYVAGVADASRCGNNVNGYSWKIAEHVIQGQVVKVVMKWLTEHPENLHFNSAGLVANALHDAFPCP